MQGREWESTGEKAGGDSFCSYFNLDLILISNGRLDKEFYGRKWYEQIYTLKSPWGCGDRMAECITAIKIATNLVA